MTKKTTIIEFRDFDLETLLYIINFPLLDRSIQLINTFFPVYSVNCSTQHLFENFLYINQCNSIKYLTSTYMGLYSTYASDIISSNMILYLTNLNISYGYIMQHFFFILNNKYVIIPALLFFCSHILNSVNTLSNNVFNFISNISHNSNLHRQAMLNYFNYISKFIEILLRFLLPYLRFFLSNPFLLFLVFFFMQIKGVDAVRLIYQPYIAIPGWFIYIILMTWNDFYIRKCASKRLTLFFEGRLNRAFITAVFIRVISWIPLIGTGVTFSTSWWEWLHLYLSSQDIVNIFIPSSLGASILSIQAWLHLGGNRDFQPGLRQVWISLCRAISESITLNGLSSFNFWIYPLWVNLFNNQNMAHILAFIIGILSYTIFGWLQVHIEMLNDNSWIRYTYGIVYLLSFTSLSHSSSGLYNLMVNHLPDTGLIIFISISGIFSSVPFSFIRHNSLLEGLSNYIVRLREARPFLYRWLMSVRQGFTFYGFAITYFYILYMWFY